MLTLIALKGHPGTGKSTLAEAFAERARWPLLDKDDFKDELVASRTERANELSYTLLWSAAERLLRQGFSVVTVSPLSSIERYHAARSVAARAGAHCLVVECRLDERIWRGRIEAAPPRAGDHRIRTWREAQELLERYQGSWRYPVPAREHLVVDTARPVDELVQEVERFLESGQCHPSR